MYRVNCSIRNARGKEIAHRTPLWAGVAEDPKAAIIAAHDVLGPIIKASPEADTIVLHISGKGLRVTATEYAEDFRIGYGASAVGGTGLLADQIDTGLTPEQVAEATRALQARAIKAMPHWLDKFTEAADAAGKAFREATEPRTGSKDADMDLRAIDEAYQIRKRQHLEALRTAAAAREQLHRQSFKQPWPQIKVESGKAYLIRDDGSEEYIGGLTNWRHR